MAQKVKQNQTNFTSGVIADITVSREDVAFYYNGLQDAMNMEVLPSGGARRRGGYQFVRKLLRKLEAVALDTATITAPEGGTTAHLIDGDAGTYLETANNLAATNPFVVAKVMFGGLRAIDAIDVINCKLSGGVLENEMRIQVTQDDVAWSDFGGTFNLDATDRSRRVRSGETESVIGFRLVRVGATNLASKVLVGGLKVFAQTADLPTNPRLVPFAYSTVEAYMMAVSDLNMDVLVGDDLVGSISIPYQDAQLGIMNWTQSLDTLITWHPDVRPQKIIRQGGDDEFDFRDMPFENIPEYDYGAGVGGVDEVQTLNDAGGFASGNLVTLLLDGERTPSITGGASRAATAAAIQAALQALPNGGPGITVADSGGVSFIVTFSGDQGKRPWGVISASVQSGNSVWIISRTVKGRYPGEAVMSDARGWPRCGIFAWSRLWMAGLKGIPNSVLISRQSNNMDLDIEIDDPDKALLFRPDSDQVGAVYQIAQGRDISLFMDDGEAYFVIGVEGVNEKMALKTTTSSGSKEGMRVHSVDGALLFFQGVKDDSSEREIATSIQEFIYDEAEQNYQSNIVSKLSSDLIKNPIDSALLKGIRSEDPAILMSVNEDGTATAYTVLRNELVNAFMPQSLAPRTHEMIKAVGVDKRRRVYCITERFINDEWVQYVERYNKDLLLDCGAIVDIAHQNIKAATDGQAVFVWTIDNPGSSAALGLRLNGARLAPDDFTVDLGTKTATLAPAVAADVKKGDVVRVARMVKEITGAHHLEGESVMTYVDGSLGDRHTVQGGAFTLNDYADTQIQYGFFFDVYGKLLAFRLAGGESLAGEIMRVIRIVLSLFQTGHVEIRVNGGKWMDVSLQNFDAAVLDKSMSEMEFTGEKVISGLKGHGMGGYVEFRQTLPARLTVRSIVREVVL